MDKIYDELTYRIFNETLDKLTNNEDGTADRCYVTSTEYLSQYMKDMDLRGQKLATVGSSGDQFFQALLQGCEDITIIDANPYTKVFVDYKKALFMNTDYETMLSLINTTKFFDWRTYAKISHDIPKSSRTFWDALMLEQHESGNENYSEFDKNMISRQLTHPQRLLLCDFYNDEKTYNQLQSILRNENFSLKFKTADIFDFPRTLKEKYDLIMLSNIFGYHSVGEDKIKFEKLVDKLYNKHLNPGGSIQVQYGYRKHNPDMDVETLAGLPLRMQAVGNSSKSRTVYFIDKPNEKELEK